MHIRVASFGVVRRQEYQPIRGCNHEYEYDSGFAALDPSRSFAVQRSAAGAGSLGAVARARSDGAYARDARRPRQKGHEGSHQKSIQDEIQVKQSCRTIFPKHSDYPQPECLALTLGTDDAEAGRAPHARRVAVAATHRNA